MLFADLLGDAGNYMWEKALYQEAFETLKVAESIYETFEDQHRMEHSKIVTLAGCVALDIGISGRRHCMSRFEKAVLLRQSLFETNVDFPDEYHILHSNAWNDIGACLLDYERYQQAEPYIQRSLEIKRRKNLSEHGTANFNYAINYRNMTLIRTFEGRMTEAIDYAKRAMDLIENPADSNPKRAAIQRFRYDYANALAHDGSSGLEKALVVHEEVRLERIKVFGSDAVHTLNSYYMTADMHFQLGNFKQAE
jgi:tetratricopeptide (TPR) repeat protein